MRGGGPAIDGSGTSVRSLLEDLVDRHDWRRAAHLVRMFQLSGPLVEPFSEELKNASADVAPCRASPPTEIARFQEAPVLGFELGARILSVTAGAGWAQLARDLWQLHFDWKWFEPARLLVARRGRLAGVAGEAGVGLVIVESDHGSILGSFAPTPCVVAAVVDPQTGCCYAEAVDAAGQSWFRTSMRATSACDEAQSLLTSVTADDDLLKDDVTWRWRWRRFSSP